VLEAAHAGQHSIEAAIRQNVRRVVRELREEASPILLHPQAVAALKVIGAYYHLSSGEVDFFDT
jgi:carbonic anhydrase